jgi:hypothetical protein
MKLGKSYCMTATAQQIRLFNDDAYAPTPPPPSFGLGRVLGLFVILAPWALIAWLIWTVT